MVRLETKFSACVAISQFGVEKLPPNLIAIASTPFVQGDSRILSLIASTLAANCARGALCFAEPPSGPRESPWSSGGWSCQKMRQTVYVSCRCSGNIDISCILQRGGHFVYLLKMSHVALLLLQLSLVEIHTIR